MRTPFCNPPRATAVSAVLLVLVTGTAYAQTAPESIPPTSQVVAQEPKAYTPPARAGGTGRSSEATEHRAPESPAHDPDSTSTPLDDATAPAVIVDVVHLGDHDSTAGANPTTCPTGSSPAIIVAVDGLQFVEFLFPLPFINFPDNPYLRDAILSMNLPIPDNHVVQLNWSRDAEFDTLDAIGDLRALLRSFYNCARQTGKKLIIVSHSWGTFLTHKALSLEGCSDDGPITIDLFVTLSSPLGTSDAIAYYEDRCDEGILKSLDDWLIIAYVERWDVSLCVLHPFCCASADDHPTADRWMNYWAWGDLVSGPISGATNIQVDPKASIDGCTLTRNPITSLEWHAYTSLGLAYDNQAMRDEVETQIISILPPPTGACCNPDLNNPSCQVTTQGACLAANDGFGGDGTTCPSGCPCANDPRDCDWCWNGTNRECDASWEGDGECDCGCQFDDSVDCQSSPCTESDCTPWVTRNCGEGGCTTCRRRFTRTCPQGCGLPVEKCEGDSSCPDPSCRATEPCTPPVGYEFCTKYTFEDCTVSIAINLYTNINDIRWGQVFDSSDPYVVGEYEIGWTGVEAEKVYYACNFNSCEYGGCNCEQLPLSGRRVTVVAPGTAHHDGILAYNDTAEWWCGVRYDPFNPSYNDGADPIYVLRCYNDSDCAPQRCEKTGHWTTWACVDRKPNGAPCTQDGECQSGFCDNDGVGLPDDGWCFMPSNTYFDGQESNYCEYSTGVGSRNCDERPVGARLNACFGSPYLEDRCSSTCDEEDIPSVFDCHDPGCACAEPLCDGLAPGDPLPTCSNGLSYFADECSAIAAGRDRGDSICRSTAFVPGCSASPECNGQQAGVGDCTDDCHYHPITFISPNGGEVWQAGTTQTISWSSTTIDGYVSLAVVTGAGDGRFIDYVPVAQGSVTWSICPYIGDGTDYTIDLFWLPDGGPQVVVSSNPFEIRGSLPLPTLTVTSPNGGEVFEGGTKQLITWNATNAVCDVRLWLVKSGDFAAYLGSAPMADGQLSWQACPYLEDGSDYRVHIEWCDCEPELCVTDESNEPFEVSTGAPPPEIILTSPTNVTRWEDRAPATITWETSLTSGTVQIFLGDESCGCGTVIDHAPVQDMLFEWDHVCAVGGPGTDYYIELLWSVQGCPWIDARSEHFEIQSASVSDEITFTSPAAETAWQTGTTQIISWVTTSTQGYINVDVYKTGEWLAHIVEVPASVNSINWTVCSWVGDGTDYAIHLSWWPECGPSVEAISASFEITGPAPSPTLSVTSPKGGEVWEAGSTHTISWSSTTAVGYVSLSGVTGAGEWFGIDSVPVADGSVEWNIPSCIGDGTDYTIHLYWDDGCVPPVKAISGPLEISGPAPSPTLTLTIPDGGEIWEAGTQHTISWETTNPVGLVDAYLFKLDQGMLWRDWVGSAPMVDGHIIWNCPYSPDGDGANYRVSVVSCDCGPCISDESDEAFEIIGSQAWPATYGDPDGNERIDLADYWQFVQCLTGPVMTGTGVTWPHCVCRILDSEWDGDIDLRDLARWQNTFTGDLSVACAPGSESPPPP